MSARIGPDAFEFYVSLGPERSYQAVADRFGVSKRAVTKHAAREQWAERLEKIERQARDASDKKLAETLEDMRTRHLKTIRAMHARALGALKQYPLSSGMEAMRAAEMIIKLERLVVGEPTERTATSVEELVRRESERWLTAAREGDISEANGEEADEEADDGHAA